MKVAVIVLNYNSSSDCRKCISFLKKQRGVDIEIVVVDNCSRADAVEQLRQLCNEQDCTLIENHENRGYNAGNNIGLRYAAEKGYKYALIANPDMEFPQEDYIARLVDCMRKNSEIVVVGSDIVNPQGIHQNPMKEIPYREELFWSYFLFKRKIHGVWNEEDYTHSGYCEKLSGCCFLISLAFVGQIDFFDENVFLYCEESILSKQVSLIGKRMYYYSDAKAIHRHIKSEKGNPHDRLKALFKSRDYYLRNYSGYKGIKLYLLLTSKYIQRLFYQVF